MHLVSINRPLFFRRQERALSTCSMDFDPEAKQQKQKKLLTKRDKGNSMTTAEATPAHKRRPSLCCRLIM